MPSSRPLPSKSAEADASGRGGNNVVTRGDKATPGVSLPTSTGAEAAYMRVLSIRAATPTAPTTTDSSRLLSSSAAGAVATNTTSAPSSSPSRRADCIVLSDMDDVTDLLNATVGYHDRLPRDIRFLYATSCGIAHVASLRWAFQLTSLVVMDLSGNELATLGTSTTWASCYSLRGLFLHNNYLSSAEELVVLHSVPSLEYLAISGNANLCNVRRRIALDTGNNDAGAAARRREAVENAADGGQPISPPSGNGTNRGARLFFFPRILAIDEHIIADVERLPYAPMDRAVSGNRAHMYHALASAAYLGPRLQHLPTERMNDELLAFDRSWLGSLRQRYLAISPAARIQRWWHRQLLRRRVRDRRRRERERTSVRRSSRRGSLSSSATTGVELLGGTSGDPLDSIPMTVSGAWQQQQAGSSHDVALIHESSESADHDAATTKQQTQQQPQPASTGSMMPQNTAAARLGGSSSLVETQRKKQKRGAASSPSSSTATRFHIATMVVAAGLRAWVHRQFTLRRYISAIEACTFIIRRHDSAWFVDKAMTAAQLENYYDSYPPAIDVVRLPARFMIRMHPFALVDEVRDYPGVYLKRSGSVIVTAANIPTSLYTRQRRGVGLPAYSTYTLRREIAAVKRKLSAASPRATASMTATNRRGPPAASSSSRTQQAAGNFFSSSSLNSILTDDGALAAMIFDELRRDAVARNDQRKANQRRRRQPPPRTATKAPPGRATKSSSSGGDRQGRVDAPPATPNGDAERKTIAGTAVSNVVDRLILAVGTMPDAAAAPLFAVSCAADVDGSSPSSPTAGSPLSPATRNLLRGVTYSMAALSKAELVQLTFANARIAGRVMCALRTFNGMVMGSHRVMPCYEGNHDFPLLQAAATIQCFWRGRKVRRLHAEAARYFGIDPRLRVRHGVTVFYVVRLQARWRAQLARRRAHALRQLHAAALNAEHHGAGRGGTSLFVSARVLQALIARELSSPGMPDASGGASSSSSSSAAQPSALHFANRIETVVAYHRSLLATATSHHRPSLGSASSVAGSQPAMITAQQPQPRRAAASVTAASSSSDALATGPSAAAASPSSSASALASSDVVEDGRHRRRQRGEGSAFFLDKKRSFLYFAPRAAGRPAPRHDYDSIRRQTQLVHPEVALLQQSLRLHVDATTNLKFTGTYAAYSTLPAWLRRRFDPALASSRRNGDGTIAATIAASTAGGGRDTGMARPPPPPSIPPADAAESSLSSSSILSPLEVLLRGARLDYFSHPSSTFDSIHGPRASQPASASGATVVRTASKSLTASTVVDVREDVRLISVRETEEEIAAAAKRAAQQNAPTSASSAAQRRGTAVLTKNRRRGSSITQPRLRAASSVSPATAALLAPPFFGSVTPASLAVSSAALETTGGHTAGGSASATANVTPQPASLTPPTSLLEGISPSPARSGVGLGDAVVTSDDHEWDAAAAGGVSRPRAALIRHPQSTPPPSAAVAGGAIVAFAPFAEGGDEDTPARNERGIAAAASHSISIRSPPTPNVDEMDVPVVDGLGCGHRVTVLSDTDAPPLASTSLSASGFMSPAKTIGGGGQPLRRLYGVGGQLDLANQGAKQAKEVAAETGSFPDRIATVAYWVSRFPSGHFCFTYRDRREALARQLAMMIATLHDVSPLTLEADAADEQEEEEANVAGGLQGLHAEGLRPTRHRYATTPTARSPSSRSVADILRSWKARERSAFGHFRTHAMMCAEPQALLIRLAAGERILRWYRTRCWLRRPRRCSVPTAMSVQPKGTTLPQTSVPMGLTLEVPADGQLRIDAADVAVSPAASPARTQHLRVPPGSSQPTDAKTTQSNSARRGQHASGSLATARATVKRPVATPPRRLLPAGARFMPTTADAVDAIAAFETTSTAKRSFPRGRFKQRRPLSARSFAAKATDVELLAGLHPRIQCHIPSASGSCDQRHHAGGNGRGDAMQHRGTAMAMTSEGISPQTHWLRPNDADDDGCLSSSLTTSASAAISRPAFSLLKLIDRDGGDAGSRRGGDDGRGRGQETNADGRIVSANAHDDDDDNGSGLDNLTMWGRAAPMLTASKGQTVMSAVKNAVEIDRIERQETLARKREKDAMELYERFDACEQIRHRPRGPPARLTLVAPALEIDATMAIAPTRLTTADVMRPMAPSTAGTLVTSVPSESTGRDTPLTTYRDGPLIRRLDLNKAHPLA